MKKKCVRWFAVARGCFLSARACDSGRWPAGRGGARGGGDGPAPRPRHNAQGEAGGRAGTPRCVPILLWRLSTSTPASRWRPGRRARVPWSDGDRRDAARHPPARRGVARRRPRPPRRRCGPDAPVAKKKQKNRNRRCAHAPRPPTAAVGAATATAGAPAAPAVALGVGRGARAGAATPRRRPPGGAAATPRPARGAWRPEPRPCTAWGSLDPRCGGRHRAPRRPRSDHTPPPGRPPTAPHRRGGPRRGAPFADRPRSPTPVPPHSQTPTSLPRCRSPVGRASCWRGTGCGRCVVQGGGSPAHFTCCHRRGGRWLCPSLRPVDANVVDTRRTRLPQSAGVVPPRNRRTALDVAGAVMCKPPVWRVPVSPTHWVRWGFPHPVTLTSVVLSFQSGGTPDASSWSLESGADPQPRDRACVPGQTLDDQRQE